MLAETKGVKSCSKPIFGLLYRPVSNKNHLLTETEETMDYRDCIIVRSNAGADGWNNFLTNSALTSVSSSSTCLAKFPMMRSHPSNSQQVKDCSCCFCSPSVFCQGHSSCAETQTVENKRVISPKIAFL